MRKGLSTTMTVLVAALVLFSSALLLIAISQGTVDDAIESITDFIDLTGDTAECSTLRTRCNTMCEDMCRQGEEPGQIVAIPADEAEDGQAVYCSEVDCMEGWSCECDDNGEEGLW